MLERLIVRHINKKYLIARLWSCVRCNFPGKIWVVNYFNRAFRKYRLRGCFPRQNMTKIAFSVNIFQPQIVPRPKISNFYVTPDDLRSRICE